MIDRVHCEWMPFMPSCHLTCYKNGVMVGGVGIRPDILFGTPQSNAWKVQLSPLDQMDRRDVPLDQVRAVLPAVSELQWSSIQTSVFLAMEFSGRGAGLWLAFGVHLPKQAAQLSQAQITSLTANITSLRDAILRP
jgi:hypothetical protein